MFYAGVDIFFFVSAYSLADREINYPAFIWNRFTKIYLKFIFLAAVFAIYKQTGIADFLLTACGANLFIKGGGSFLWFAPAIMLVYLTYPWFTRWSCKYKGLIVLTLWALLGIAVSSLTDYRAIFIFWNRIPVILLGYYAKKMKFNLPKWTGFIIFPLGCLLLYFFGVKYPLSSPIVDLHYTTPILFVPGLALLSGYVKNNKVIDFLSSFTFELYGIQVIFAVDLVTELLFVLDNALLVNLLSISIFLCAGYLFHIFWKRIANLVTLSH